MINKQNHQSAMDKVLVALLSTENSDFNLRQLYATHSNLLRKVAHCPNVWLMMEKNGALRNI